jgi:hypothetical protein
MNNNEQEQLDKIGNEKVIDEHLKENSIPLSKKKMTKEDLATYVAMVLILVAAVVLVYIFLDKQGANPFKKSTTTSQPVRTIDTTSEQYVQPKTITTTTSQSSEVRTQGTTNINEGATEVPPTTFHTVQSSN